MTSNQMIKVVLSLTFCFLWPVSIAAQAAVQTKNLEGIWEAKRFFGPAVEGTLEIVQTNGKWNAQIAQFDVPAVVTGDRLSFELPGGQGRFEGRVSKDSLLIRGHWIQPPTVNSGGNFNSPVVLRTREKNRWSGEVLPLKDEWTVYLVLSRKPDGTFGAFIRNPDRNIGMFWYLN